LFLREKLDKNVTCKVKIAFLPSLQKVKFTGIKLESLDSDFSREIACIFLIISGRKMLTGGLVPGISKNFRTRSSERRSCLTNIYYSNKTNESESSLLDRTY